MYTQYTRIRDMVADLIYWWTYLDYFFNHFGKQNWHCGMDWKCAVAVWCLASNSHHGGQKQVCLCYHARHLQQNLRINLFCGMYGFTAKLSVARSKVHLLFQIVVKICSAESANQLYESYKIKRQGSFKKNMPSVNGLMDQFIWILKCLNNFWSRTC